MAYDVFISYSTKNLHIVDWAVKTLHQQGHIHVFAAEYSVQPSQVLNQRIELAIRGCDLFILLWSHEVRASDYVPQEIGIAKGCNKVILPVVMEEGVPVPGFVSDLNISRHTRTGTDRSSGSRSLFEQMPMTLRRRRCWVALPPQSSVGLLSLVGPMTMTKVEV